MAGNTGEFAKVHTDTPMPWSPGGAIGRPNYLLLNDGSDDEALPEDRIKEPVQSEFNSLVNTPLPEIPPLVESML